MHGSICIKCHSIKADRSPEKLKALYYSPYFITIVPSEKLTINTGTEGKYINNLVFYHLLYMLIKEKP